MVDEWIAQAAIVILCIDAGLFFAVWWTVRRGIGNIKATMVDLIAEPESMRLLGEGFARGMRQSMAGKAGKDKQITEAEEKAMMVELLESWMTANTPILAMAEKSIPEFRQIVKKHPEVAFGLLQRFGPAIESKIGGAVNQGLNTAGGMIR